jgi:hypothetical protein
MRAGRRREGQEGNLPGAGTPTKRARARERERPLGRPASLCSARRSSGANTLLIFSERSASSIGAMGTMFPSTQMRSVSPGERPIQLPTGTPPRSSMAGNAEMKTSTAQSGSPVRCSTSATWQGTQHAHGRRKVNRKVGGAVRRVFFFHACLTF